MKSFLILVTLLGLGACSSKKKLESVKTEMDNSKTIDAKSAIGQDSSGETVYQEKTDLVEYLLDLEKEVYSSEDTIFGNRAYGKIGKYGALENCMAELQKKTSGQWGLVEMPEKVILTKLGGPAKKAGIDEKKNLVVLTKEEITGRIKRMEGYKENYEKQLDWYDSEIKNCSLKLKNPEEGGPFKRFPSNQSSED